MNHRPLSRHKVRKGKSARSFSRDHKTAAVANLRSAPMRGGWRF